MRAMVGVWGALGWRRGGIRQLWAGTLCCYYAGLSATIASVVCVCVCVCVRACVFVSERVLYSDCWVVL